MPPATLPPLRVIARSAFALSATGLVGSAFPACTRVQQIKDAANQMILRIEPAPSATDRQSGRAIVLRESDRHDLPPIGGALPTRPAYRLEAISPEKGWQVAGRPANPRGRVGAGGVVPYSVTDDEASVDVRLAQASGGFLYRTDHLVQACAQVADKPDS